ncbi:peptide/nickel transport system ATP-binding protein/nickel transport system ATP-binding protein [Anaerovirgula multivorans]|uniref:Peptide/nickel transport system ATP-binding protein/nickel transport system ATP-binding protein n=1 Tax=Anaerovirgula multivorans TaxID=312168 RepID=A0A239IJ76_9FIRM|nr:ABC transporter ATP-binding protein [Anaerovirgula multivorans]SNS93816.1 peptide/nickel transport system ATP-binding protein/nickel transport system ATP-binding protein [Anaerovirgula multivorans]
MSLLKVENVSKVYKSDRFLWGQQRITEAVKNVDLIIEEGTCLGLVGESGCGKSTLGKVILGLLKPNEGEVIFQGKNFCKSNGRRQYGLRRDLQVVFQDYSSSVNPKHNVEKIISEPIRNYLKLSPLEEKKKVLELLEIVGLNQNDIKKYPHQFSGGQLQRICIAKAIALKPKLIVLDEAISSLDVSVQAQILNLLLSLKEQFHLSYLFISHDIEAVSYIADRVAIMYLGRIVEEAENIKNLEELKHPYSKKLLASVLNPYPEEGKFLDSSFDEVSISKQISCGCNYIERCEKAMEICHQQVPTFNSVAEGHKIACHCEGI